MFSIREELYVFLTCNTKRYQYAVLSQCLEGKEITSSISDSKVQAQACGLLEKVACLDFIVAIMSKTKILVKLLQRDDLNILDALKATRATIQLLGNIQSNDGGD